MPTVLFCKDCRWCAPASAICYRPKFEQFDLVTGIRHASAVSLPAHKERDMLTECGPDAVFFEAKSGE